MSTLILAVPSKGRLMENANAFFARAGLSLVQGRGGRDYRGTIPEIADVEVAYLSAADIATSLAQGTIHIGITGEDLVRESIPDADNKVVLLEGLRFGYANVSSRCRRHGSTCAPWKTSTTSRPRFMRNADSACGLPPNT